MTKEHGDVGSIASGVVVSDFGNLDTVIALYALYWDGPLTSQDYTGTQI